MTLTKEQQAAMESYNALFEILEDDDAVTEGVNRQDRAKMKDSEFAYPEKRLYPINNEDSVKNAIKFFRFVKPKYGEKVEKEVAKNLIAAAKKFKIEIRITADNPFKNYYSKAIIIPKNKPAKK